MFLGVEIGGTKLQSGVLPASLQNIAGFCVGLLV
jgi:hypothetical protein